MSSDRDRRGFLKKGLLASAGLVGAATASSRSEAAITGEEAVAVQEFKTVPRRKLGKTGEDIPILVLGGSMSFDPKYDKILHRAYKDGVNYIDTALVYANGNSHKTIAPFIKQIGDRKKLWITSKAPHGGNRATVKSLRSDLDTCLKQLDTSYLDLFFVHQVNSDKYMGKEFLAMADQLKKEKKIRFFGFSCHDGNVVDLLNKAAKTGGIDAIMFRFNYAQYGNKELNNAIDACHKAGIGLIAMKTQRSIPNNLEEVMQFQSKNFNLPQAKLKYVWEDERISGAVSHIDNLQKLEENVAAAKSPVKLTSLERDQLYRLAELTAPLACEGCNHICETKAGGSLKIADPLRFLMYAECYGEVDEARRLYQEIPAEQRSLESVELAEAAKACPQGIDIEARLRQVERMLA